MTTKKCANCDREFEIPEYFNSNIFHCQVCAEKKYSESLKKSIRGLVLFAVYESALILFAISMIIFLGVKKGSLGDILLRLNLYATAIGIPLLYPFRRFFMFKKEKAVYDDLQEVMDESGE